MKNLVTIICAILFSTLFYQQNIGINLSLFTVLTIIVLGIKNFESFKNKTTILIAIGYVITGISVFMYKSDLSIIANIIAFFTLVGTISEHKSSIYIQWINGVYTTIVAAFSLYYDSLNSEVERTEQLAVNTLYTMLSNQEENFIINEKQTHNNYLYLLIAGFIGALVLGGYIVLKGETRSIIGCILAEDKKWKSVSKIEKVKAPTLIIIGDVVSLRDKLRWMD